MKALLVIVSLLVGVALGAGGMAYLLRGTVVPTLRQLPAPDTRAAAVSIAVAADLAAEQTAENPYRQQSRQASTLAEYLPTNTAPVELLPALREYGTALRTYAAETEAAADATSGLRGAAGSSWHEVKSWFGDEPRELPNKAALRTATQELEAAAAHLAEAFVDREVDLAALAPDLPGLAAP